MVGGTLKSDLIVFGLGPVQSFIASARRTQDLWLGSDLLSALALVGLQAAVSKGATPLFPVQEDGEWPGSIPNRFMLVTMSGRGPSVACAVEDTVRNSWLALGRDMRDWIEARGVVDGWQSTWDVQLEEWMEVYWVSWPWTDEPYGEAYRHAGLAFDARKQIRHVPKSPQHGEKCSLCGLRQALCGSDDSRQGLRDFWEALRLHPAIGSLALRPQEQLCAICTIKRLAGRAGASLGGRKLQVPERFPSTSSIAVLVFKARLLEHWDTLGSSTLAHLEALRALWLPVGAPFGHPDESPFLQKLARRHPEGAPLLLYDGDFFYQETFSSALLPDTLGRMPSSDDRQKAAKALGTLRALLKIAKEAGVPPPHPYLAILLLDGDHMGQLLGQSTSIVQHQAISNALGKFAEKLVPDTVESEFGGRLVYAGGDDVLALLPVEHALLAADRLQKQFNAQSALQGRTASVGIALVHHKYPLGIGLRAARTAEHLAKERYNRDALVVDLQRRSGEPVQAGLKWHYSTSADAVQALNLVKERMLEDRLSTALVYDLRQEAGALAGLPHEGRKAEIRRLLARHWLTKPLSAADKAEIADLAEELAGFANVLRGGLEELAEWLLLVRFLAQGEQA